MKHSLDVTHDNAEAHAFIGGALVEEGLLDEAYPHLSEALRISPTMAMPNYRMARLLARQGDLSGAKEYYLAALRAAPDYAEAHAGLGHLLAQQGDTHGAEAHYQEAIRLDPDVPGVHTQRAIALEGLGRTDEAIAEYTAAVWLEPQRVEPLCNLAAALASAGHVPEAIAEYRTAVQLAPEFVEARFGLASAYARAGQTGDAIRELDEILHQRPDATPVEVLLAWLLATTDDAQLRNGPRAVQLAEAAVERTNHSDAEALNSLAAAYAEAGRFKDAIETATKGQVLARDSGQTVLDGAFTGRLARYRAGQPVRQSAAGGPRLPAATIPTDDAPEGRS